MSTINIPVDNLIGSANSVSSTCILSAKSNEQKKKDLVTRLLKDDLITLDDVLLLLDKAPAVFGTTCTQVSPHTPFTYTTSMSSLYKELIN